MIDAEYEELDDGSSELDLADTDNLPWLESDADDEDAGGLDVGQILGFAGGLILLLAVVVGAALLGGCAVTPPPTDLAEQARYLERMDEVLAGLKNIRASIPDPWWFIDDGVSTDLSWDEIDRCLERCHQTDFWTAP